MVLQCVLKLMLSIFEFWVLLFVYYHNVTCRKHLIVYGHYAGEMKDIVIVAVVS